MINIIINIIVIISAYILIGVIEWYPMLKKKENGIFVYGFLFLGSFVISLLLGMKIKVPNPAKGIEAILSMLLGWR